MGQAPLAKFQGRRHTLPPATIIRVRPWVRWWFYIGVACGVAALANIFFRDLTRAQEQLILLLGVIHWVFGGLVCWAWEGVTLQKPAQAESKPAEKLVAWSERRVLSNYLMVRGFRQTRRQALRRRGLLGDYLLKHWEKQYRASGSSCLKRKSPAVTGNAGAHALDDAVRSVGNVS